MRAFAWGSPIWLLVACGAPHARVRATAPAAPPATSASVSATPAPPTGASSAPESPPATRAPAREYPGLLVRVGSALMPIGCYRRIQWVAPTRCLPADRGAVTLYPPFAADPVPPIGIRAKIYFIQSGTHEDGLRLVDANGQTPSNEDPPLAFATVGTTEPVRLVESLRDWMKSGASGRCGKICEPELAKAPALVSRDATPLEARAASVRLSSALRTGGVRPPRSVSVRVITVRRGGADFELTDARAELQLLDNKHWNEFELRGELHYLFETSSGRLIAVSNTANFGLAEGGELLAAIDLDGDGSDELVLRTRYSEGYWIHLARWEGEGLNVVGEFGKGG